MRPVRAKLGAPLTPDTMKIDLKSQRFAFVTLLAAALFGASTPIAKSLVGSVSPSLLAGLLYCGSGLGLLPIWLLSGRGRFGAMPARKDWPWLLGAVAVGGVIAPLLLMYGLQGTAAGSASMLLNLESVLTVAVAALLFREAVDRRIWWAAAIMLLAATLLVYEPSAAFGFSMSAVLVVGACLMWALDNNLTRGVSATDAVFLAMFKGLVAGAINVSLAKATGSPWPPMPIIATALLVGFLGYGVSLTLFIVGLRHLGSARAGAHFSAAPFFGGAVAILILGEALTSQFLIAAGLMAFATYLVLSENHEHAHQHEPQMHDHRHVHDEHHHHEHDGSEGPEPHVHVHRHDPLAHSHKHLPDEHHRHSH